MIRQHHTQHVRVFRVSNQVRIFCASLVLMIGGVFFEVAVAQSDAGVAPSRYERPSVENIRSEAESVLRDPRFVPRKSLQQWLFEQSRRWTRSNIHANVPWISWILWILWVLCILIFLALLVFTIYNIVTFRRRSKRGMKALDTVLGLADALEDLSYDALVRKMREYVEARDFRKAIGFMMVALLKWLDLKRILSFHRGKSNGDYVLEFPLPDPQRSDFRSFVRDFDAMIYGGRECDEDAFERMNNLFVKIRDNVQTKQ